MQYSLPSGSETASFSGEKVGNLIAVCCISMSEYTAELECQRCLFGFHGNRISARDTVRAKTRMKKA